MKSSEEREKIVIYLNLSEWTAGGWGGRIVNSTGRTRSHDRMEDEKVLEKNGKEQTGKPQFSDVTHLLDEK